MSTIGSGLEGGMETTSSLDIAGKVADRAAKLAVAVFLVFLFLYGICIGGLVYKEPDICFLLASGKWIVTHGQLPASDPFSYTTHFHWAKYVIEKWLTEVIFFSVWSKVGDLGLLVFDSALLALAFAVMPMRILYLAGWRGLPLFLLVALGLWTSMSHLAIRPEVFSFLITGIFLEGLMRIRLRTLDNTRVDWTSILILGLVMCAWSNLHTLFLVGLLLPALYSICLFLERMAPELKKKPINWTVPILFILCLFASLINPYGIGLWEYMPNVFGPFNDTNLEMQPISWRNAASFAFWPFYVLSAYGLWALCKRGFSRPLKQGDLFFRLLVPLGIAGGIKTIRSIPLADLFLLSGIGALAKETSVPAVARPAQTMVEDVDARLSALISPMKITWAVACVFSASLGTLLITNCVPPEIPQDSKAFHPPFKAIEYISGHTPTGNLLNDPHFGNVMMWRMSKNPPVFIDSRYNLFGNDLLQDYWRMVKCRGAWKNLLDKYKIDWIFLPPGLNLGRKLADDPKWKLLYSDSCSVIYARNQSALPAQGETAH
jgi:hypothetical protein